MASEGCRFRGDAFHHATVTANCVDMIVEDLELRLVIPAGKPLLGDSHTHASRDALPERTAGSLNAGNPVIFRMPGRFAVELTEPPNVI
jgi:hypothetical protein